VTVGSRRTRGLLLGLALAPAGCGGGGGAAPTPPSTMPPGPSRANISLTVTSYTATSGGVPGFAYSLRFAMRVRESAGVGANLNFIRLGMYSPTGSVLELTETGSDGFPGGNRLDANGTRDFDLTMGFDSDPLGGRFAHVGVGTTDDIGNDSLAVSERLYFP
jgi:hypothetical protein